MGNVKETLIELTKELGVGDALVSVIDFGIDLSPYIGQLTQTRKINRAERRIKEHAIQLQRINKLFSSNIISAEFIQEKVGPIVLSDLIEEHEDAKLNYILNGFENIFIDQNTNESIILNYFDTLRSLRYEDIKWLYYYAAITEKPIEDIKKNSREKSFFQQIYTKLERFYLVKSAPTWAALGKGSAVLDDDTRKTEMTPYGLDFISFISKEFDYKKYSQKVSKYNGNE